MQVQAGEFLFSGANQKRTLPAFCIDRTEVRAADFLQCVAAGACAGYDNWPSCKTVTEHSPSQCQPSRTDYPANWIDWARAEAFCRWAGKRLPTDAEWEKAARGPSGQKYPWGATIDCSRANYARSSQGFVDCHGFDGQSDGVQSVGSYAHVGSPYGTANMAGNVKEWIDARADRTKPPVTGDPVIAMGGDFVSSDFQVQGFSRDGLLGLGVTAEGNGFRCAW